MSNMNIGVFLHIYIDLHFVCFAMVMMRLRMSRVLLNGLRRYWIIMPIFLDAMCMHGRLLLANPRVRIPRIFVFACAVPLVWLQA